MWLRRWFVLLLAAPAIATLLGGPPGAAAATDQSAVRQDFLAAMQKVRFPESEVPDSPALQAYAIYDYLVAARLRRDLDLKASDELDAAVDAFLQAHGKQPVTRALRQDWFLPRATDAIDPVLICDRLQGRLESGDTKGLGIDALVRWNMPQKAPRECDGVFAWLHQQGMATPALAEVRTRAALAGENRKFA